MSEPLHLPKKCRSCGSEIFWGQMPSGKGMPVDAAPVPHGNIVLLHTPSGGIKVRVLRKDELPPPGAVLRTSHFSTCPNSAQHRRAR